MSTRRGGVLLLPIRNRTFIGCNGRSRALPPYGMTSFVQYRSSLKPTISKPYIMIKELQIRPFARPLLVRIAGIMLQTVFSCCTYSWVLLLLPVIILTTAGLVLRGQEHFCYETRWLWGSGFLVSVAFPFDTKRLLIRSLRPCRNIRLPFFPVGRGKNSNDYWSRSQN